MKKKELSEINEEAIENFMIHDKAGISNPATLRNHESWLRSLLNEETGIKKDYNKITQRDLDVFFGNDRIKATSREVIKTIAKKFFKHYEIDLQIQSNGSILAKPTKGEEAVLTAEEIEMIIETPVLLSHKAIVETLVITGARKSEIRMLNLGDVKIDKDLIWINVRESKTKVRKIPIAENPDNPAARYPKHLIKWIQSRSGDNPNAPLFYAMSMKNRGDRFGVSGIYDVLKPIKKKVNLNGKKLTPHILRHTAATYDGAILSEQMLCQKYGWVLGSDMVKKYCHFNERQLGEQILKQAGLKPDEAKSGKACPRCGELNNIFAKECSKCHQILDPEMLMKLAEEKALKKNQQDIEFNLLKKEVENLKKTVDEKEFETYSDGQDILAYDERIKQMEEQITNLTNLIAGLPKDFKPKK